MDLRRGKVIYAEGLVDLNGNSKSPRRVIVLQSECQQNVAQCVVAATLRAPEHDSLTEVVIPHGKRGQAHPQTSFERPTVAICNWIVDVPYGDFRPEMPNGKVGPHILQEINQTINLLIEREQSKLKE